MKIICLSWLQSEDDSSILLPLTIAKLPPTTEFPTTTSWASPAGGKLWSLTRTEDEVSIICPSSFALDPFPSVETSSGWVAFKVKGQLDFSLVGILATITSRLADVGISIFATSTFLTDYVLLKACDAKLTELALDGYCGLNREISFETCLFVHKIKTRVLTLTSTLERLFRSTSDVAEQKPKDTGFVLHCVGADEIECSSLDELLLRVTYNRLFRHLLLKKGIKLLDLVFIGPNLPTNLHGQSIEFVYYYSEDGEGAIPKWPQGIMSKLSASLQDYGLALKVRVQAWVGLYHEHFQRSEQVPMTPTDRPDLVALFNPGLWGYDAWLPTLEVFKALRSKGPNENEKSSPVFVVTSYTLEEAEDDMDVVEAVFSQGGGGEEGGKDFPVLWGPELNAHYDPTKKLSRITAEEGRHYYDSQFVTVFI